MALRNEHASMRELFIVARAQLKGWGSRGYKEQPLLDVSSLDRGGGGDHPKVKLTKY